MSKIKNVNFCYICDLAFETKMQFVEHNLSDEHLNRARNEYEDEVKDATMETVYDSDQDENFLTPNSKTTTKPKTQIQTQSQSPTESMPKVVVLCWVCDEKFKNDFAQKAHKNKHWRENIASTSNYDIKSSFNHRQLYITKSNNELIENIKEPLDYILDGSEPNKSYKNKVTVNCLYRKRASEEEEAPPLVPPKNINTNFRTEEYMNKDHRLDLYQ